MPTKVMVTGHSGSIGTVVVRMLKETGYEVLGVDSSLFEPCCLGPPPIPADQEIREDVRDLQLTDFDGVDAVIHLAALSNGPLGRLSPRVTFDINHRASVKLAQLAKRAGVPRFLYSSSCSVYGATSSAEVLDETAAFNPVGAYGESKVLAERELSRFADQDFCPVYLRSATAYGFSPHLRSDLVVNSFTGCAYLTGKVLIKNDGSAWRPFVHVEDIAHAFMVMLTAPREKICNEAFNVGRTESNHQIREVAEAVRRFVPGTHLKYVAGGRADQRCYRIDFTKIHRAVPDFAPQWTLDKGIEQLCRAFHDYRLDVADFDGPKFLRIKRIQQLINEELVDRNLRWIPKYAHA